MNTFRYTNGNFPSFLFFGVLLGRKRDSLTYSITRKFTQSFCVWVIFLQVEKLFHRKIALANIHTERIILRASMLFYSFVYVMFLLLLRLRVPDGNVFFLHLQPSLTLPTNTFFFNSLLNSLFHPSFHKVISESYDKERERKTEGFPLFSIYLVLHTKFFFFCVFFCVFFFSQVAYGNQEFSRNPFILSILKSIHPFLVVM